MMNFNGKVAIVTGASKGIGKAIALKFADCGASIVLNYSKDDKAAQSALEEVQSRGVHAILVKGDISNINECKVIIDKTIETYGKIDFLINNAAISKLGLFIDADDEEINNILDINIKGALNLSKIAMEYLTNSKGVIVNISSIWGTVGASCEVLYSTTKGAINLFTKALAKEMALSGVRINAVSPGVIDTDMNKWMSQQDRIELEGEIPLNRFGKTEEVANVVLFLCSEESSYMTGQILTVDGGML